MSAPGWACALLRRLAPPDRVDDVLGDLEEAHRRRVARRGRGIAAVLTGLEALDLAGALLRERTRAEGRGRAAAEPVRVLRRRGPDLPGVSWLDVKLGVRMLGRYPGLTLLGALSMAFAVFVAAGAFELVIQVGHPRLPFPEGDRLVALRLWDAGSGETESRALHDFGVWREELRSVQDLGAFRTMTRNLFIGEGATGPVTGAEISASAFRAAPVPARLGRVLLEEDERPGAPLVAVIGHELWRTRFGSDPGVVGRGVRLGSEPATVVGVMPEGFGFPIAHELWIPLRLDPLRVARRQGPAIQVFGRLAAGASLRDAQREVTGLAGIAAGDAADPAGLLRPQVEPFALSMLDLNLNRPGGVSTFLVDALLLSSNVPVVLFLVLVCGNVALLVFARAATREGELLVRSALGAGRRRIVMQLFTEALVLAGLASALGLTAVGYGLRRVFQVIETEMLGGGGLPFWFHASLSPVTLAYAAALTVLAAAVAGVLPALRVTRGVGDRLRRASAGGGGFQVGGVWTVVIVSQIALTVLFPVVTVAVRSEARRVGTDPPFAASEFLSAGIELDTEGASGATDTSHASFAARFRGTLEELEERLRSDPRVAGVTFAERMPGMYHPWRQVEVEGGSAPPPDERGHRLGAASVAPDFFEVLGVEVVAGRGFGPLDAEPGAGVVVVNESFVRSLLGGGDAVGRRIRYVAAEGEGAAAEPGPWHEVVGVVADLGRMSGYGTAGVYHPAARGSVHPVRVAVHVRGGAAATFTPELGTVAAAADPGLRLRAIETLDEVTASEERFYRFWFVLLTAVCALGLLLSIGGIYAVTSLTVSRRTREIGIRVALGSSRGRVLRSILRRPLTQLALGILAGAALLASLVFGLGEVRLTAASLGMLAAYLVLMTAVCLLACVVPMRRALAVEPREALGAEG